jgi:hypothetical protein
MDGRILRLVAVCKLHARREVCFVHDATHLHKSPIKTGKRAEGSLARESARSTEQQRSFELGLLKRCESLHHNLPLSMDAKTRLGVTHNQGPGERHQAPVQKRLVENGDFEGCSLTASRSEDAAVSQSSTGPHGALLTVMIASTPECSRRGVSVARQTSSAPRCRGTITGGEYARTTVLASLAEKDPA